MNMYSNNVFEDIKHIDECGNEYWFARELQKVLEYKDWRNFQKVIDKAVLSANYSCIKKFYYLIICIGQRKNKKRQQYVAKCSLHNL